MKSLRRYLQHHPIGATMLGVVALTLLLSVLPLPDALRPYAALTTEPKATLLAAVWPRQASAVPEQPPPPELVDEAEAEMMLPELDFSQTADSHGHSGLSAEDEKEGRRWEALIKKVSAEHVEVEEPCLAPSPDGSCRQTALDSFFRAVDALRAGQATAPVRVVTLGTSLIASDHITDVARRRLQSRHGTGGLGYMYVERPTRNSGRTVRSGDPAPGAWKIEKLTDESFSPNLGLAGVAFSATREEPQQTTLAIDGNRTAELYLVTQPGGGELEVVVDGRAIAEVSTAGDALRAATSLVELPPGGKTLVVRTRNGPVRLDGISLEMGKPGMVFDSLGLPGGAAYVFTRANDELFAAQLAQRHPALVILMMGGNEAFDLSLKRYTLPEAKANFVKLIGRVKRIVPNAACLLASPPDAGVWKMDKTIQPRRETAQVAAFLHDLAFRQGCGFWDMQQAMGGEGAILRWWSAGLMNQDLVHPIGIGGDVFGYLLDVALERARVRHESALAQVRRPRWRSMLDRSWLRVTGHDGGAHRRFDGGWASADGGLRRRGADGGWGPDGGWPRRRAVDAGEPRHAEPGAPDTELASRKPSAAFSGPDDEVDPVLVSRPGPTTPGPAAGTVEARPAMVEAAPSSAAPRDAASGLRAEGARRVDPSVSRPEMTFDAGEAPPVRLAGGAGEAPVRADAGAAARAADAAPCGPSEACYTPPSSFAAGQGELPLLDVDGGLADVPEPHTYDPGGWVPLELARPEALKRFFSRLRTLETEHHGRVSVVQIGASHTAAQHFTDAARDALAERFGYAGRGFVAAGKASDKLVSAGVHRDLTGNWVVLDAMKSKAPGQRWGLTGVRAVGRPGGAFVVSFDEPRTSFDDTSRIQVHLLESPGMGPVQVFVNGQLKVTIPPPAPDSPAQVKVVELAVPGSSHEVRVYNPGPGDITLFGVSHELVRPGVVYDALGLPGSTAMTFAGYHGDTLASQLRARQPDLYVMFFGTNEAALPVETLQQMREAYQRIFDTLRSAAPDAECLFLGPTDRMTKKKKSGLGWHEAESLDEVYQLLEAIAAANGCAFWSTRDVMGGDGSIEKWRAQRPPLANKDHVHLTTRGYHRLANGMVDDVLHAYDAWKEGLK